MFIMSAKYEKEFLWYCAQGNFEKVEETLNSKETVVAQKTLDQAILKTCENYLSFGDHLEIVRLLKRYF